MTSVIYTGRHGVVSVPCPDGREETVKWGDELTTTPEHAASLLEQADNWKAAPVARKKTAPQPAAADETKE